ncbi:hypothetical protein M433DRAFT_3644 [Acidomyces richmondensis BFW]|nr:hypothetical protein M433DRAFT_3644 [Acidomyces richmondensis BFW]
MAEDQTMPTSPGVSLFEDQGKFPTVSIDKGASRRIRPGSKAEEMAEGPPLVPLHEIESAFPLTEHLKAQHYAYTHPSDASTVVRPLTADIAQQLARPPAQTSREIWLYELARFLIQKTNAVLVALFADTPPCSPLTCPEMRASEWQYLCAVHDPPKSCSAIDYCCHTLDWAATTLTSNKMFPRRIELGSGAPPGAQGDKTLAMQMKEITNIFRRVYRIYAHAWFQHRDMFWRVEGKTGLYIFFKTVCDEYGIIQPESYTIPPEAEGLEPTGEEKEVEAVSPRRPAVLKRDGGVVDETLEPSTAGNEVRTGGDTTKRHRHSLSDRAPSVTTVIHEEVEEEDEAQSQTPQDARPILERQGTSLKDFAGLSPQPAQQIQEEPPTSEEAAEVKSEESEGDNVDEKVEDEEKSTEESMLGISRSETLRPTISKEEEGTAGPEEDGDQTVVRESDGHREPQVKVEEIEVDAIKGEE